MRNVAGGKTAIKKIKTASVKCLNKNAHSKCYSKPISFAIANLPVIFCHKPPVIFCHINLLFKKPSLEASPPPPFRSAQRFPPGGKEKKRKNKENRKKRGFLKKTGFPGILKISAKRQKTKEKAKTFAQGKKIKKRRVGQKTKRKKKKRKNQVPDPWPPQAGKGGNGAMGGRRGSRIGEGREWGGMAP